MLVLPANAVRPEHRHAFIGTRTPTYGVPFAPARARRTVRVRERFRRDATIQVRYGFSALSGGEWCLRRQWVTRLLARLRR